jgi:hypothetical protein
MNSWERNLYDATVDSTPLPKWITLADAKAEARRAFWRGVVFGGILTGAAFIAGAAWPEPLSISGTMVTLEPAPRPAVAVVTMHNISMNGSHDNGEHIVSMPGMSVVVVFQWEHVPLTGADSLLILPPDGMICDPSDCLMIVPEGQSGQVFLMEWMGG